MSGHIDWWNHKAEAEGLLADAANSVVDCPVEDRAVILATMALAHATLAAVSLDAEKRL